MYMVFCVLDDPNQLEAVLEAWDNAGIPGATIVESTGINRHRRKVRIPMPYLFNTTGPVEESHYTLFALVEDDSHIQICLQATERVVGDLSRPNTGIFAAWPLSFIKGLPKNNA